MPLQIYDGTIVTALGLRPVSKVNTVRNGDLRGGAQTARAAGRRSTRIPTAGAAIGCGAAACAAPTLGSRLGAIVPGQAFVAVTETARAESDLVLRLLF